MRSFPQEVYHTRLDENGLSVGGCNVIPPCDMEDIELLPDPLPSCPPAAGAWEADTQLYDCVFDHDIVQPFQALY